MNLAPESDEEKALERLSQIIFEKFGYDFRNYNQASFKRRVHNAMMRLEARSIDEISKQISKDPTYFVRLLDLLTVTVTELFRDPEAYAAIRSEVVPYLKTYPEIKVWSAGCATGEEAYSTAIMLKEEHLLTRSLIYGTDINVQSLRRAKNGVYPVETVRNATRNYMIAGGTGCLSGYFTAGYDSALINEEFKKFIVFADHCLGTDGSFGEVQMILCRNVLIYFNNDLRERSLDVFNQSLCRGGFLCLGSKESLSGWSCEKYYKPIDGKYRIYQKI